MKKIFVYADCMALHRKPILLGILYSEIVNWKERLSFTYSDEWLNIRNAENIFLDPDIKYLNRLQFPTGTKKNFGVFTDASPDGWGKSLMRKREHILARKEGRKERHLFESDFLLGVYDPHRIGGLRFKEDVNGDFLSNNSDYSIPPVALSLRELQQASMKFEEEDIDDMRKQKWIEVLFANGSSIGGARPKASVVDKKGNLWIAKFPSSEDREDIGTWEMVVHSLAKECGIKIPEADIQSLSPSKGRTFLSKRFDRTGKSRIHFASAMTTLGVNSMEERRSYLDIAEFIIKHGVEVKSDLKELWSRIVFNICVSNTDDHLRNHGFLLTPDGWKLSPAYDINPSRYPTGLSLNISENDNSPDLGLAIDVAKYFYVDSKKANSILKKIKGVVRSNWELTAKRYKIQKSEIAYMKSAFMSNTK